VADFTYVPLATGGFCYTAFVIDAFAGLIVGWECSISNEKTFVASAVRQAVAYRRRQGRPLASGTVHHSPVLHRPLEPKQNTPRPHSLTRSLTARCAGHCPALGYVSTMPSPNHSSQHSKRASSPRHLSHPKEGGRIYCNYIEVFYNQRRIHSARGYRAPHEVRTDYLNSKLAA